MPLTLSSGAYVKKAGDTMAGTLNVPQLGLVGGNSPGVPIGVAIGSSWLMQDGAAPPPGFSPWQFTQTIQKTDGTGADPCYGISSLSVLGNGGVAAKATPIGFNSVVYIRGCGSTANEDAAYYGAVNVQIGPGFTQTAGPSGRHWFTDFSVHGPIAVQPGLLNGVTMLVNNHYNGSPIQAPSAAFWAVTKPGGGGSIDGTHAAAATYPVDVGIGVAGISTGSAAGFASAIKVGGTGSGWGATSRFNKGIEILDYDTVGLQISGKYTGSTPTASILVAAGVGPVVIGGAAAVSSSSLLEVQNTGTADPLVSFGAATASDSISIYVRNSVAFAKIAMAGGTNSFITGTAAGDLALIPYTAKKLHLGGTVSVLAVTADDKLGFFNVTPVARVGTYAASNVTTDRTYDANATSIDELADVLGTLISDLRGYGLVT
jgi:hypothetical protein